MMHRHKIWYVYIICVSDMICVWYVSMLIFKKIEHDTWYLHIKYTILFSKKMRIYDYS